MKQEEQELLIAKDFFESIGIECYDIKSPINSDIYCIKRIDCQWAAFKIGNPNPIVPFGRYNHMWGYDAGYCLVSVPNEDSTTFANRGIIDEQGLEVVKPYTFNNIYSFYGRKEPYIIVYVGNEVRKLNKKFLKLL